MTRVQRYLETLGRLPTAEEYEDVLRMSRRGFFGGVAALLTAPYFGGESRDVFQGSHLDMIWIDEPTLPGLSHGDVVTFDGIYSIEQMYRGGRQTGRSEAARHLMEFVVTNTEEDDQTIVENLGKGKNVSILHKARQA